MVDSLQIERRDYAEVAEDRGGRGEEETGVEIGRERERGSVTQRLQREEHRGGMRDPRA
jgi:hypothetical protein